MDKNVPVECIGEGPPRREEVAGEGVVRRGAQLTLGRIWST